MLPFSYEKINLDPNYPVIFHIDSRPAGYTDFIPHWHEHPEILRVIRGHGQITAQSGQIYVKPGDIAVINSNQLHSVGTDSAGIVYCCLIIGRDFCESSGVRVSSLLAPQLLREDIDGINEHYGCIERLFEEDPEANKTKILAHILMLLDDIYGRAAPMIDRRSDREKAALEAMKIISLEFDRDITLDYVASRLGFSRYYFCRIFKQVTGMTFTEYLNYIRCAGARRLLVRDGVSVSAAAYASGFKNLSYFTRTYKRLTGTLPKSRK